MVTIKEFVRVLIKEDGKDIAELRSGDDLWRMKNRWTNISRVVDWKNNRYRKTITDSQTGEIVHHCDEPLDWHQGHGSARKRTRP